MPPAAEETRLNLKAKGDLAELTVAVDLLRRAHKVAIPYGEDCDFDLILIRGDRLERVQVKHARSDGAVINVRCHSHSLTNGKIRRTKELGTGRSTLCLRLTPARNGQRRGTRPAEDYLDP